MRMTLRGFSGSVSRAALPLVVGLAVVLSGCGLIRGMQGDPEEEEEQNECGGDETLVFQGEEASVGDSCGPCELDTIRCDDADATGNSLVCSPGETPCRSPSQLTATSHVDHVFLEWDHVEGAEEYELRRDGDVIHTEVVQPEMIEATELTYRDEGAEPGRPDTPVVEVVDPGASEQLVFEWEPVDVLDGPEHDYEVVAVYPEFGEVSEPVAATGYREAADFELHEYRFGVEGEDLGEWLELELDRDPDYRHVLELGGRLEAGHLPSVEIGSVTATEGEYLYEVHLELDALSAEPTVVVYQVRAVTESGVSGDAGEAASHLGVEEFEVEWQRAVLDGPDDEDPDEGDFASFAYHSFPMVEGNEEGYEPSGLPYSHVDLPPTGDVYAYRVAVETNHGEQTRALSQELPRGFRGAPAVFTASDDETVRRLYPHGGEAWSYTGFARSVLSLAVDDEGNVYAGDAGGTVRKIDFDGELVWEFTGHEGPVHDIAVDTDGTIYTSAGPLPSLDPSSDPSVRRLESNEEEVSEVGRWPAEDDDDFENFEEFLFDIAIGDERYIYLASGPGYLRKIDMSEQPGDDRLVWEHSVEDDESVPHHFNNEFAVAIDAEGYVYWGQSQSSFQQIDPNGDDGFDVVDSFGSNDLYGTDRVMDMVASPSGRLYATVYYWLPGHRWVPEEYGTVFFRVDPENDQAEYLGSIDDEWVTGLTIDAEGHLYYSTYYGETVHKLERDNVGGEEIWRFDGHDTESPDFADEDCWDNSDCTPVNSVRVTPGEYPAFSEAWEEASD